MNDDSTVTFTVREILDGINEKLAKSLALGEQMEKRISTLETRVQAHDRILSEQLPKFQKVIEDLDVQSKVEAALDSHHFQGVSNIDRFVASAIGLCILALGAVQYLPHLFQ